MSLKFYDVTYNWFCNFLLLSYSIISTHICICISEATIHRRPSPSARHGKLYFNSFGKAANFGLSLFRVLTILKLNIPYITKGIRAVRQAQCNQVKNLICKFWIELTIISLVVALKAAGIEERSRIYEWYGLAGGLTNQQNNNNNEIFVPRHRVLTL